MSANAIAQKALEGATDALKSKNYVKAIKIIEKGLEILYRNPVMNRNQIAILRQASQDISGSRGITFGMGKRTQSKTRFGFGEDLYHYLVYEDEYPVFIIVAEDEKHAEEKLMSFADSEEQFAMFYNKIRENSITANPYISAVKLDKFLSEKNGVPSEKAKRSRQEYLRNYRINAWLPCI